MVMNNEMKRTLKEALCF